MQKLSCPRLRVSGNSQTVTKLRDALAHRIPLYIPPATWTTEDSEHYARLEAEKIECIKTQQWERLDAVWNEQEQIGKACLEFMHEYSGEKNARPVFLHSQLLCDSMAVIEFGKLYLSAWRACAGKASTAESL